MGHNGGIMGRKTQWVSEKTQWVFKKPSGLFFLKKPIDI
jgi:hypothetical protein